MRSGQRWSPLAGGAASTAGDEVTIIEETPAPNPQQRCSKRAATITLDLTKDTEGFVELVDDEIQILNSPTAPPPKRPRVCVVRAKHSTRADPNSHPAVSNLSHELVSLRGLLKQKVEEVTRLKEQSQRDQQQLAEMEQAGTLSRCGVCWEGVNKNREYLTTPCGHLFCKPCLVITMRTKKQCPLCRKAMKTMQACKRFYGGA